MLLRLASVKKKMCWRKSFKQKCFTVVCVPSSQLDFAVQGILMFGNLVVVDHTVFSLGIFVQFIIDSLGKFGKCVLNCSL